MTLMFRVIQKSEQIWPGIDAAGSARRGFEGCAAISLACRWYGRRGRVYLVAARFWQVVKRPLVSL